MVTCWSPGGGSLVQGLPLSLAGGTLSIENGGTVDAAMAAVLVPSVIHVDGLGSTLDPFLSDLRLVDTTLTVENGALARAQGVFRLDGQSSATIRSGATIVGGGQGGVISAQSDMLVEGSGSSFDIVVGEGGQFGIAGTVVVRDGGEFTGGSGSLNLSVSGRVEVLDGGTFALGPNLDMSGTIAIHSGGVFRSGTLYGDGRIEVEHGGVISDSINIYEPGITLALEVSDEARVAEILEISRSITLSGTLELNGDPSIDSPIGTTFNLIDAGSVVGEFDQIVNNTGLPLDVLTSTTSVVAIVTPEPSTAALLALGLGGIGALGRKGLVRRER